MVNGINEEEINQLTNWIATSGLKFLNKKDLTPNLSHIFMRA